MNYSFYDCKTTHSRFIHEDYFPVIIEFSDEELNNLFMEFTFEDSDMFELAVNPKTYALKRFSLTLCNHYEFKNDDLKLPEYEEGVIHITGPITNKCPSFKAYVYKNGIEITISSEIATKHLKSGHLIFALTENNELTSVLITDLTPDDLHHVKTELTI